MTNAWNVLVRGGIALPIDPGPASLFLRSVTPGVYTTTRTAKGASRLLLWDRHLARLLESLQLFTLAYSHLYPSFKQDLDIDRIVQPSLMVGLARALQLRRAEDEVAVTVLLCAKQPIPGDLGASPCEVYVHASNYAAVGEGDMPPATTAAVMGPGRTLARAKHSLWARTRQALEEARPAGAGEIILSNDGDSLLEGTLTNFFVVTQKDQNDPNETESMSVPGRSQPTSAWRDVEVQTAPLEDGVLPGVIRQLVIEVCREVGIPMREVAPSWARRQYWREAFVTSSIRIVQPVVKIQRPTVWTLETTSNKPQDICWQHVKLEAPGRISQAIHKMVLEKGSHENITIADAISGQAFT